MPMGSPLSPILANIVLQDLEQEIITTNNIISSFYFRYVDDIVLALHKDRLKEFWNCLTHIMKGLDLLLTLAMKTA